MPIRVIRPVAAAVAGLLAILLAITLQAGALWLGPALNLRQVPFLLLLFGVVAPLTEEPLKLAFARLFRVPWGAAGLAFGAFEAVGKLSALIAAPGNALIVIPGALVSLALHWGLGRMAAGMSPTGYALAVAILLHAGMNLAGIGTLIVGSPALAPLVTLTLAGALLWSTRRRPLFPRDAAPTSALTRAGPPS